MTQFLYEPYSEYVSISPLLHYSLWIEMEENFCLRLHTFASVQSHYPLINSHLCILNRIHFTITFCKASHSSFVWFWCVVVRHDLERKSERKEILCRLEWMWMQTQIIIYLAVPKRYLAFENVFEQIRHHLFCSTVWHGKSHGGNGEAMKVYFGLD